MKIFFSHSSRDKAVIELVRQQLSDRFVPWIDERELLVGNKLDETLRQAIMGGTGVVVAFLSKDAVQSAWVRQELTWALEVERLQGCTLVLPVMLERLPPEEVPDGLRGRIWLECIGRARHDIRAFAETLEYHLVGWLISRVKTLEDQRPQPDPPILQEADLGLMPSMPALEKLTRALLGSDASNLDVVGYSVHEMLDMLTPALKRALAAAKRVRVLMLAPGSRGHLEKSSLEVGAHPLALEAFRKRSRDHVEETIHRLRSLAENTKYQTKVTEANLQIRLYNQFPVYRGVLAEGIGFVMGNYLYDSSQPGRTLPHYIKTGNEARSSEVEAAGRVLSGWFEYLWSLRSRTASIECVIFDLYDTLISVPQTERRRARSLMANKAGIDEAILWDLWSDTEKQSNEGAFPQTVDRIRQILQMAGKPPDDALAREIAEIEHECLTQHARPLNGTHELLDSLRDRGYRLGLLSNCSPSVWFALRATEVLRYFDVVSLSYEMRSSKPDVAVYRETVSRLESFAERCVFVGDGNNNELPGASAAGLKTILFGQSSTQNSSAHGHLAASHPGQVLQLLDAMP